MDAHDRRRAEELFQAAADLPASDRAAYLDRVCESDALVRRRVESLLRSLDAPDSTNLDSPVISFGSGVHSVASRLPTRVGRYRIVRLIGEGGMGAVYEAQQESPKRPVAIKVIRSGLVSRSTLQRFEQEFQVLGKLNHPGIAQVYEAGIINEHGDFVEGDVKGSPTPGQPFFAMELIQGLPIDSFADAHDLSSRDRLALVALVCDAVEHAHQHGVVHRDLKPANILVVQKGGAPTPKVLDFGVARVVDSEFHTITLRTGAGELVGTLAYMSPEQASGDVRGVDGRSDIYALGVLTYQLLAGRLPLDLSRRSIPEAARMIREDEPSKLGSINVSFRGDIETMVSKAIEKDKQRRYESPAELASDIRRFLNDQPIVARPSSSLYQLRKFAKRNRGLVGGISATMLAMLIGTGVSLRLAWLRAEQRAEADDNAARAERLAYRSSITAAYAAIQAHNTQLAITSLNDAPESLRGWEWGYLAHLSDRSLLSTVTEHRSAVNQVAFSPDGNRMYAADTTGVLTVFDAGSGARVASIQVSERPLANLALSPDGERLLTRDTDGAICVWGTTDWARIWSRQTAYVASNHVFSRDGSLVLFSPSGSSQLEFVDSHTGSLVATAPLTTPLDSLAWAPDERSVLLVNRDGKSGLYDIAPAPPSASSRSPETLSITTRWQAPLFEVVFNHDGSRVLGRSMVDELALYDAHTGQELGHVAGFHATSVITGLGEHFAAIDAANGLVLRDSQSFSRLSFFDGFRFPILAPPASFNGRILAGSAGGEMKVFDAYQRDQPFVIPRGVDVNFAAALSPVGNHIACAGWGSVSLWNAESAQLIWSVYLSKRDIYSIAFSPKGDRLAAWLTDRGLVILDANTGAEVVSYPVPRPFEATSLVWSDGGNIVVVDPNAGILMFSESTGLLKEALATQGSGRISAAAVSDGDEVLGVGAFDGSIAIYDQSLSLKASLVVPAVPRSIVSRLAFSPDGAVLAARHANGVIVLVDVASGTKLAEVDTEVGSPRRSKGAELPDPFASLAFSPDGKRLAAIAGNRTIRFWDCKTWEPLISLACPAQDVVLLSFSADGARLVAAASGYPAISYETKEPASRLQQREVNLAGQSRAKAAISESILVQKAVDAVRADESVPDAVRTAASEYLRACGDHPHYLNSLAWGFVQFAGGRPADYSRGLVMAQRACELAPENLAVLNTLGIAQYRTGLFDACIATLQKAESLYAAETNASIFSNLAFIAMSHRQLGHAEESVAALAKAHAVFQSTPAASSVEDIAFMNELHQLFGLETPKE